ncbi:vesicle formation at the endoplasmic reticulum [Orbilia brochopaga]|uniref:tripeptidyl-peptidase II n=1 Tax=Orbilia brochopaga TaxID=3140254 RepID=A0AAV9U147_9PEZI
MHFSRLLVVVPALLVGVYAIPFTSYQQFESLPSVPKGWEVVSERAVDPSMPIKLRIHLVKQNVEAFRRAVIELSTPGHPSYGNHMSQRSIDAMLRPREENFAAVKNWLASQGLADKITLNNDWIQVSTTIGEAESLLHTKYQVFQDTKSGDKVVRALSYSIPRELHSSINFVQPTTMFGRVSAMRSTIVRVEDASTLRIDSEGPDAEDPDAAGCNTSITPKCLADLYKYADYDVDAAGIASNASWTNQIGINGFLEQYAQNDDLSKFLKKYALTPKTSNSTFTCQPINNGLCTQHPQEDFTEANLDIQYTVSGTGSIPNIYFSTAGRPPAQDLDPNTNEPYLDWVKEILELDENKLPQTITTSYGDDEHTVPRSYAIEVCDKFAELGARGVTLLFSSGDSGPGSDCQTKDGKKQFVPTFPATCPFVTSVGGTVGVNPERAVGFSSGGFSNYFPRPDYQDALVGDYLAKQSDPKNYAQYFNATGRGFPDVSAQGQSFHVFVRGFDTLVSGTSASSPALAAIISLWNQERRKTGKKPLGFLNPLIYSTARSGFVDITAGSSRGCSETISGAGWKATTGWDPVTGLGTPDFSALKSL